MLRSPTFLFLFCTTDLIIYQLMFNILFCYFPITFRPPPNDKYGINTGDLKAGLL